ncbi:DEMETER-like protein 2 [Apium graveolens]|uniref:DEMETER-like protein 2 n=1 Tax=Apium graveolens TaxID=4045 RepID=UPI003D7C0CEE
MEEECVKDGVFAPVTPGKHNVANSVMINGRKQVSFDGEAETSGLQLFVDLGDLVCVNDDMKFDCEAPKAYSSESDTISINIPFPAMQLDDASHQASAQVNGAGFAFSTPEKHQDSKMRDTISINIPFPEVQHDDASHQVSPEINGAGLASLTPEKHQDSKERDTISINIPFSDMQHDDALHQASPEINGAGLVSLTLEKNQDFKKRDTISINIPFSDMLHDDASHQASPEINGAGLASLTPEKHQSSKKRDTINDASLKASAQINGAGLASATPEKHQDSKKRFNSSTDVNEKTPQKPKRHRPKILDESIKRKTAKAQVSGFTPKTPLKRSTPKQCAKKSHVKKKSSRKVSDSSEDVVQRLGPQPSCKRALNSDFDKEAEAENVCHLSEDVDDQFLSLNLSRRDEKRFAKQYQRRRKKIMDNTDVNMVKPAICVTAENITPESNVADADPQSSWETADSSQLGCEMDHLPNVMCGFDSNLSTDIFKEIRDCVTNLPSSPAVRRRKRSTGCTKRRIYASQPIRFKCSQSPLVNLLEHLTDKKHRSKVRLATQTKKMKRRKSKIKPSLRNQMMKMIKDYLPRECLLSQEDPDEHSSLDYVVSRLQFLSIHENQKSGQLVVRHQSVGAPLVLYEGKFDPRKKNKKVQATVDLDKESEKAWLMLMGNGGSTTFDEPDLDKEYWDRERQVTIDRVESLIAILREFQGNRRFSKWKGSVMDSVVGAYLTQNVTDHLSSSAYMTLAARYPARDSKRSNGSHESECTQPLLDLFPQKDAGLERLEHGSTSHEIEHYASTSENGSPESSVTCMSTTNNQANETEISVPLEGVPMEKKTKDKNKKERNMDWDSLRKTYSAKRERNDENMDGIDWQSVRQATIEDIADSIKERGMQNVLARKIKDCLNRTFQDHGSTDLEWLRDVPPKDAKDYLLSIYGMGLKSVECIRLLTLHQVAFPVDVNVGRVAVRLGWVPLQPLPGGLQMHLLEEYPIMDKIQKYLYPRLCTLDHETLYELHYHLITFGKVFCTKANPRCEGCPLKGQCKHYESLSASKRSALPAPATNNKSTAKKNVGRTKNGNSNMEVEPVVEMPTSPEHHIEQFELGDIEDLYQDLNVALPDLNDCPESDDEILTIRLDDEEYDDPNEAMNSSQEGNMSHALSNLSVPSSTPIPNYRDRLKSVHQVYVLPDSHPLLEELQVDKREPDDPSHYLFAPWAIREEGSTTKSSFPQNCGSFEDCRDIVCCSTLSNNEEHGFATTISGTLLIPVRTANRGRFPLNGTYFQVNEVFADEESTKFPIIVPTYWLYGLQRSILYCGASVSSTFRDIPMEHMHYAFSQGFFCNRGFNRNTRYTTFLSKQFHIKTSMQGKKTKGRNPEENGR